MSRTLRLLPLLALAALTAASAQTDGFLVTNTAGDTLFYAAPDGTVLYGFGPDDSRVQVANARATVVHTRGAVTMGGVGGAAFVSSLDDAPGYEQAGYFGNNDTDSVAPTVQANHYGLGPAVFAQQNGLGPAVFAEQNGAGGHAGEFQITDAGNGGSAVYARTGGTGGAGSFFIDNPANTFSAVFGRTSGTGAGVQGRNTGTGTAVVGLKQSDTGRAGEFNIWNSDNDDYALYAYTQGTASAVFGTATSGRGGQFLTNAPTSFNPALEGITYGTGVALRAIQNSGGGNTVADFVTADDYANWNVVARIDTDGNVYADGAFNGGGADFAERFEVIGGVEAYEVGDVLAISPDADRHLERSAEPYSTRILGVYATRPGVLLGDPSIDEASTVPVGVVGVVPTKVTGEGGPIRRGDLLVTSSTAAHAMRGEPGRVGVGMVIGKALQDFDGERGVIEVMVNVQ